MGLSASAPWLAYYGNTPKTLRYPHKTMFEVLSATAKQYPDNTAYVFMGKETSYSAFMKRIDAAAKGLYNLGIRKGDKVTVVCDGPSEVELLDVLFQYFEDHM